MPAPHSLPASDTTLRDAERTLRGLLDTVLAADAVTLTRSSTSGDSGSPTGAHALRLRLHDRHGEPIQLLVRRQSAPFGADDSELVARLARALGIGEIVARHPRAADQVADYLERGMSALDGMSAASASERLVRIASDAVPLLELAGWSVSSITSDEVTVHHHWARSGGMAAAQLTAALPPQLVDALDGSSRVLLASGGDPCARILSQQDLEAAVVVGGFDPDARQWLVTMTGDDLSVDLRLARPAISALFNAALGFPRPPRARG